MKNKNTILNGFAVNFYYEAKSVLPIILVVSVIFVILQTIVGFSAVEEAVEAVKLQADMNSVFEHSELYISLNYAITDSPMFIFFTAFLVNSFILPSYIALKDNRHSKRSYAIKTLPFPRWINVTVKLAFALMMPLGIYLCQLLSVLLVYGLSPIFVLPEEVAFRSRELILLFTQQGFVNMLFPPNYGIIMWLQQIAHFVLLVLFVSAMISEHKMTKYVVGKIILWHLPLFTVIMILAYNGGMMYALFDLEFGNNPLQDLLQFIAVSVPIVYLTKDYYKLSSL